MQLLEDPSNTGVINAPAVDGWGLRASWRSSKGWVVLAAAFVVCLFFCLRIKLRYLLVFDSVNFALGLDHFDVTRHQPHPPGYPGYVLVTKLLHRVLRKPPDVFFTAGVLATACTAYCMARLGEAMGSAKAGIAGAVLLIFNTSNTSSIVISSVRNYLAVTSALIAWLAWLTWTKEHPRRYFFLTTACLGLLSSFRPELTVTLLPLLVLVGVKRRLAIRDYLIAALLYAAAIFLWLIPTARPAGGLLPYFKFMSSFFADQAAGAITQNGRFSSNPWLYMVWKGTIWTFLSVLTWIWAVPFTWKRQTWPRQKGILLFLAFWLLPGFVFSCVVHINQSGHALATVTALCMLGGLVLATIRRTWLFAAALLLAAYGNIYIFEHPVFPYDEAGVPSIKANDRFEGEKMDELVGLARYRRLTLVTDSSTLSWRTMHYYFPETPLVSIDPGPRERGLLFPGADRVVRIGLDGVAKIPACGLVAWVVKDPKAQLVAQLPGAVVPDWKGNVTLTRSTPGLHVTVSGMPFESDASLCSGDDTGVR